MTAAQQGATVKDGCHDVLIRSGHRYVFGNPGSSELPFLDGLPERLRWVGVLQESVALAAADGYAQFAGPAAVLLHGAPGLGNAAGQLANAHRSGSPLVLIAGRPHRSMPTGAPFADTYGLEAGVGAMCKGVYAPQRPGDVPAVLAQACHLAQLPPTGPVLVTVPGGDWAAPANSYTVKPAPVPARPDHRTLGELFAALRGADAPAFVVGAEVDQGGAVRLLMELADAVGAEIWHAPMAWRRAADETHPRFVEHLPAAPTLAAKVLTSYDLVVAFGTVDTWRVPPQDGQMPIMPYGWVVSEDQQTLARTPGVSIAGSPADAVRMLVGMSAATPPRPTPRPAPTPPQPGTAGHVYRAIREVLPSAILAEEAPAARPELHEHYRVDNPRGGGYYTSAAGTLGGGLAGAVGIALARPDQQVVAVVGDGSALYTIQALHTAAQLDLRHLVYVVLDNGGYQTMRAAAGHIGADDVPGLDITGIDWPALAAGFGMRARTVTDPDRLADELRAASSGAGPALIHVPIPLTTPTQEAKP